MCISMYMLEPVKSASSSEQIPSKYGEPLGPLFSLGDLRAKIKDFSGHTFRGASGGLYLTVKN